MGKGRKRIKKDEWQTYFKERQRAVPNSSSGETAKRKKRSVWQNIRAQSPAKRGTALHLSDTLEVRPYQPPVVPPSRLVQSAQHSDDSTSHPQLGTLGVSVPALPCSAAATTVVSVGDRVLLTSIDNGAEEAYIIVCGVSVFTEGLINEGTPLAKALLGAQIGQILERRNRDSVEKLMLVAITKKVAKPEDHSRTKNLPPPASNSTERVAGSREAADLYEGENTGEAWRDFAREHNRWNSGCVSDNYGDESNA